MELSKSIDVDIIWKITSTVNKHIFLSLAEMGLLQKTSLLHHILCPWIPFQTILNHPLDVSRSVVVVGKQWFRSVVSWLHG
jgi:hypothetical protein